jgi:transposase
MHHIGVDLHKDSLTVAVMDNQGSFVKVERISTKCIHRIEEFFREFKDSRVLVEAVGFYHWFWDLVKPLVSELVLVNAIEIRKYSLGEAKTDYKDARKLAEVSFNNEVNRNNSLRVYVPDMLLRTLREATRHRHQLSRSLAHAKVRFRRYLLKNNFPGPKVLEPSSIQKWLRTQEEKLNPFHRFALRQLEDQIISLSRQLKDTDRLIDEIISDERFKDTKERITSVCGIGDVIASTIIAEIGDFNRFPTAEQLASYSGLVPRVFQSADECRHGKITKQGSGNLRWVLQEAAWCAIRHNLHIRAIFNRISRRAGKKKAACAIARKILVWLWGMERNKTEFRYQNRPAETLGVLLRPTPVMEPSSIM